MSIHSHSIILHNISLNQEKTNKQKKFDMLFHKHAHDKCIGNQSFIGRISILVFNISIVGDQ